MNPHKLCAENWIRFGLHYWGFMLTLTFITTFNLHKIMRIFLQFLSLSICSKTVQVPTQNYRIVSNLYNDLRSTNSHLKNVSCFHWFVLKGKSMKLNFDTNKKGNKTVWNQGNVENVVTRIEKCKWFGGITYKLSECLHLKRKI